MKRLIFIGVALAILIGALSSHSNTKTSATAATSEPTQTSTPQAPTGTRRPAAHASYTRCDQNISAGPHTTCGFADNVFRAFASQDANQEGGSAAYTVSATSPATSKTYSMSCQTSSGTTECSGGSGARVRFPLHAAQVYFRPSPPPPKSTPSYGGEPSTAETPPEEPEAEPPAEEPECTNGSYVNAAGNTVCSPEESTTGPPAGASAECEDGTYSFSESRSGTCSDHGGVAKWLQ